MLSLPGGALLRHPHLEVLLVPRAHSRMRDELDGPLQGPGVEGLGDRAAGDRCQEGMLQAGKRPLVRGG
jgi:hypothetical protein